MSKRTNRVIDIKMVLLRRFVWCQIENFHFAGSEKLITIFFSFFFHDAEF